MPKLRPLDVTGESIRAGIVRKGLKTRFVGQESAIGAVLDVLERYWGGLTPTGRPVGSLLFLGPTGSGKTRLVEALSECILGDERYCLKIDCGEFQHSHDIAKLLGSPPGYLGHRETPPRLTQANLDQWHTPLNKLTFILFDEIEKASDALWHLMLGILDKARVTLGHNEQTDFQKCVIFMTSNCGSADMAYAMGVRAGFIPTKNRSDKELATIATEAAKRKFTPEFINRLDHMVAFHVLTEEHIREVVELEILRFQEKILTAVGVPNFGVIVSPNAKAAIMEESDPKRNGRGARSVIEKKIQTPIARALSTKQIKTGDKIVVDYIEGDFTFGRME